MIHVRPVQSADDLATARRLFEAYARSLPFALDFQGFREELDALPGEYAPPGGGILLAQAPDGETAAGCVALRPLADPDFDGRLCEMKRLYVRPSQRGRGAGHRLVEAVLRAGRQRGYDAMRLDTVASMTAANALYRSAGFYEIDAYRHNPLDGPVFFERSLHD